MTLNVSITMTRNRNNRQANEAPENSAQISRGPLRREVTNNATESASTPANCIVREPDRSNDAILRGL